MAEETATKPKNKKANQTKMWLGALILLVLVLGGINFYYMKKNKALQAKLDKPSTNGTDLGGDPIPNKNAATDSTTSLQQMSMAGDNNLGGPQA
ncbi:hypothetical protein [Aureispira anguillae]|uniref:Uncharacterized protein n=1 Tax=Aureispira anguillae TaxID=2864201 RepID=A0A915YGT4_9BACT|nr:hypothetical protein [Aureispira anguillae]BDS12736.1 hypothetical protein AsAng_0034610 [Aureispira anguillae]